MYHPFILNFISQMIYVQVDLDICERYLKNMLEYNEFAYKKTNNHCKLEDRFQKKAISQLHIREFAEKDRI